MRSIPLFFLLLSHVPPPSSSQLVPHRSKKYTPDGQSEGGQSDRKITLKLLGVGQGTTGTRTLWRMMCEMGFKACHGPTCCNIDPVNRPIFLGFFAVYQVLSICTNNDAEMLRRACGLTSDLRGFEGTRNMPIACTTGKETEICCRPPLMGLASGQGHREAITGVLRASGCDAAKLIGELHAKMTRVLTSGIQAFTDVPVGSVLPSWKKLVPEHSFRVLMTTRDPVVWAERRIEAHGASDPMCRGETGPGRRLGDFEGCIEEALRTHQGTAPLLLNDTFVPLSKVSHEARENEIRAFQDRFVPDMAKKLTGRPVGDEPIVYGPRFLELDFFERRVNRAPMIWFNSSDTPELARRATEDLFWVFRNWWHEEK